MYITEVLSAISFINPTMSSNFKRIPVYLRKIGSPNGEGICARFSQCILDYFEEGSEVKELHAELVNNKLVISDDAKHKTLIKMKHPPFCPVKHLKDETSLAPEIANRGIDVGAAVILETGDGKVLLTRRAKHLRAFPGIWVPPGGHIEENESFVQAGLREFEEETGLKVQTSDCVGEGPQLLALWESVYPPRLSHGPPKRHHVVVYMHCQLKPHVTSDLLQKEVRMQPEEVDACAWLDRHVISAIVKTSEEDDVEDDAHHPNLPHTIR